jgi:hypothetical protein
MKLNQIAAIITKATANYEGAQRALCAEIIKAAHGAMEHKTDGIAVFRETMLAEREKSECKNIRHYYATLAGRAKYLSELDTANCKTLSGLIAQTGALIDLEIKAHDLEMSKAKADALAKAEAAKAEAAKAEAEATKAAKAAKAEADSEAAQAKAEAALKAAEAKAVEAAKAEKAAAQVTAKADSAAKAAEKVAAKEAPKQITAAAPKGKGEELKPASAPSIPKPHVVDVSAMAAELATCAAELAATWGQLDLTKPSKTIAGKVSVLINRMAATSAELAKATK